jgi:hypothetical protein
MKVWFLMWVLHIQLNAHNEGLVFDVGIFSSMHIMNDGFVMHVLHVLHSWLFGQSESQFQDVGIAIKWT